MNEELSKELDAAIEEHSKLDGPFSEIVKLLSSCKTALSQQKLPQSTEDSPTKGMNLGERIAHVGVRENAAGYIEFGSVMAVKALIDHVLRDIDRPFQPTAQVPQSVVAALREIASWLDYGSPDFTGGPTYHEADMIGMEISGPTGCGDASACLSAARKAFLVAADIWEQSKAEALKEQL